MTTDINNRFEFGKNWTHFLEKNFSESRVNLSQKKLLDYLQLPDLKGKTFLDIGNGSGLHSLAALKAGAKKIISFDYDQNSVDAAKKLWEWCGKPNNWTILQGSVLDVPFMESLEKVDIVYSWGVLHHTGDMWNAIRNARIPLKDNGIMFIALYSFSKYRGNQLIGEPSPEEWLTRKQAYNKKGLLRKRIEEYKYVYDKFVGVFWPNLPLMWKHYHELRKMIMNYEQERGMSFWIDIRDWLGGWPMEFVREDACLKFCEEVLDLETLCMVTHEANTEFLFRPKGSSNHWDSILKARNPTRLKGSLNITKGTCTPFTFLNSST